MKHLVTFAWTSTVTVDLPDDFVFDTALDLDITEDEAVQSILSSAQADASNQINWKSGTVIEVETAV